MHKLEFGIFEAFGVHEMAVSPVAADVYEDHLQGAEIAEQAGYKHYFFIEHQNSPLGQLTAPSVYLAALAQRTSVLRFGAMIFQLPFHHPIRLAQDLATLDHLSRGRLEFAMGLGIHEHEFLRWNLDFSERRAMAAEAMTIILKAWTEESVTYEGKYWQFDEAFPRPKPYQKPHPPIWVAAHSHDSFDYAAEHNYHVAQNIDVDEVVAENFDYYRRAWKECGHPGPMPRTFLTRHVHVAETDEKAREEAEPHLLMGYIQGIDIIQGTRIGMGKSARGTGYEDSPGIRGRGRVFQETAKSYDFWVDNGIALVGSPDTVIRRIEEQRKLIGYDVFCTQHRFGRMPREQSMKSLKLFGERVIPAFDQV